MAKIRSTSLINDANLVALYEMDESLTTDSKGSYTLTNENSVLKTNAGYGIGCADFGVSNTNKRLSTTNTLGIDGGACSFSFWVKLPADITSGVWSFFGQANPTGTSKTWFFIRYNYDNGNRKLVYDRARAGIADEQFVYSVNLGTSWHHLVMTYNGSLLKGYLDGSLVGSVAASGTGAHSSFPAGFTIGADTFSQYFCPGWFDDFAVFNRELTSGEVSTIYADPKPVDFISLGSFLPFFI